MPFSLELAFDSEAFVLYLNTLLGIYMSLRHFPRMGLILVNIRLSPHPYPLTVPLTPPAVRWCSASSLFSSIAATSHLWLLSTLNVTGMTE